MGLKKKIIILGIETSCDETSAAIVEARIKNKEVRGFRILSNIILSQIRIHKKYGGIVPEIAARNHVQNLIPVLDQALMDARVEPREVDLIAVTYGPGLITSLMVGIEAARCLAFAWNKPIVRVDHIKAHVFAALLPRITNYELRITNFPILALVVSGGHTELLLVQRGWKFKKIGQTLDDAAGEAFDKVAKMLGLGFPGGPEISKLAEKGNPQAYDFPRPMMKSGDFNFSFSGLKTAVLYTILKNRKTKKRRNKKLQVTSYKLQDLASSFQQAVVDVLVAKTIHAALQYKVKTLIVGGGVAANVLLRQTMKKEAEGFGITFIVPEVKLCTDNAAPIAVAGYFGKPVSWEKIRVNPNLER